MLKDLDGGLDASPQKVMHKLFFTVINVTSIDKEFSYYLMNLKLKDCN